MAKKGKTQDESVVGTVFGKKRVPKGTQRELQPELTGFESESSDAKVVEPKPSPTKVAKVIKCGCCMGLAREVGQLECVDDNMVCKPCAGSWVDIAPRMSIGEFIGTVVNDGEFNKDFKKHLTARVEDKVDAEGHCKPGKVSKSFRSKVQWIRKFRPLTKRTIRKYFNKTPKQMRLRGVSMKDVVQNKSVVVYPFRSPDLKDELHIVSEMEVVNEKFENLADKNFLESQSRVLTAKALEELKNESGLASYKKHFPILDLKFCSVGKDEGQKDENGKVLCGEDDEDQSGQDDESCARRAQIRAGF